MNIGTLIRTELALGTGTEAILEKVRAQFPQAKTTAKTIAWYRSQEKKRASKAEKKAATRPPVAAKAPGSAYEDRDTYRVTRIKTFSGMEGQGFNADLLRNGMKVAEVVDDGNGGSVMFHWVDWKAERVEVHTLNYKDEPHVYKGTPEEKAFVEFATAQPPTEVLGEPLRMSADLYVSELVERALIRRRVERWLKDGKVILVKDDKTYTFKGTVEEVRRQYPDARVLNGLPLEKIVDGVK